MATRIVKAGQLPIGGGSKISVQTMLKVPSADIEGNVSSALELEKAGCDILRMAVPDMDAVKTLYAVKQACRIPMVADIHFDYQLAIESVAAGADKIRINPGNIGAQERIKEVAHVCRSKNIPIRIGVNSGSLEKHILAEFGVTAESLAKSALYNVELLEKYDFNDIVLSVKSSDPKMTVEAYRILAKSVSYPLHLGVTEAGTATQGILKSAAAIGSLLLDGIGDTIRVSLTGSPMKEVEIGNQLLASLNMGNNARLVSCPTCGRTRGPVVLTAEKVEQYCTKIHQPIVIAVMGCEVNGPGEAVHADLGIAFGNDCAVLFSKGKIVSRDKQEIILQDFFSRLEELSDGQ